MPTALKTYVTRSIERLYGIIEGISIDYELNDSEIISLLNWLETHDFLLPHEPFKSLKDLLDDILEDGIIDPDEREDLLEWCSETINDRGYLDNVTSAIRRLHGVMSGLIADKIITISELQGLKDWLLDYEIMGGWWPFSDLNPLVDYILSKNDLKSNAFNQLKQLCEDFTEIPLENVKIHDDEYFINPAMKTPSPIFRPIASICDKQPKISFKKKKFCFTGPAASGKRKNLHAIVHELGGTTHHSLVQNINYLIIGHMASPAWTYSTYGRKIEEALNRNTFPKYKKICIAMEKDFVKAAQAAGSTIQLLK